MEEFANLIIKNLKNNGFPEKNVSLPTEKMYEVADNKGLSLNKVLDYLADSHHIQSSIEVEKIIFRPIKSTQQDNPFAGMDPQAMMQQAQEMMAQMDPEQLKAMQEQFANMSEEEKAELMQKGKDMGII